MAKLPLEFENTKQLKNMLPGQVGYIVPWGMWVDLDGNAWLNENYEWCSAPYGTSQLKIERVDGGYIAYIYELRDKRQWTKQEGPSYLSPKEVCYGKVVGFGEKPGLLAKLFSKN